MAGTIRDALRLTIPGICDSMKQVGTISAKIPQPPNHHGREKERKQSGTSHRQGSRKNGEKDNHGKKSHSEKIGQDRSDQ